MISTHLLDSYMNFNINEYISGAKMKSPEPLRDDDKKIPKDNEHRSLNEIPKNLRRDRNLNFIEEEKRLALLELNNHQMSMSFQRFSFFGDIKSKKPLSCEFNQEDKEIDLILGLATINSKEKLRRILNILIFMVEYHLNGLANETEESLEQSKINLLNFIEFNFSRLFKHFIEMNKYNNALIKLFQIFDLLNETFENPVFEDHKLYLLINIKNYLKGDFIDFDWREVRKLCEIRHSFINSSHVKLLVDKFMFNLEHFKRALIWKNSSCSVKIAEDVINSLIAFEKVNPNEFYESLIKGRFDKGVLNRNHSLVLGDEGGLFLLLNTIAVGSAEESIILESGVTLKYLNEKRNLQGKIILGKGSFGKVRLTLSIFGNEEVDIGQLICVKKTKCLGERGNNNFPISMANITRSTFDDYFVNTSDDSAYLIPKPVDMAIISNKLLKNNVHKKGYLFMEIFPENTADIVFTNIDYQKWEYQKIYIMELMKNMYYLLLKENIFNLDLKPKNTLFDPISRKMAIIDLGSAILIEKESELLSYDASNSRFAFTKRYCPPEFHDVNKNMNINLLKALSFLCGKSISDVTSGINNKLKLPFFRATNTDLEPSAKERFEVIVNQMIEVDPCKRMNIDEAILAIESVGSDYESMKMAMYKHYVYKAREMIQKDPTILNLNIDIFDVRRKGVIELMVVDNNPRRYKRQEHRCLKEEFDDFFEANQTKFGFCKELIRQSRVFLLLGEAGSGKSLSLQMRFLEELENWEYGKPLPIFFNMADDTDLERIIRKLNGNIGCNLKLDLKKNAKMGSYNLEEIHLFVDSYDGS